MSVKLKPVAEQVLLITGASSGIGLLTAQTAAAMGAKVVLVSRNQEALEKAVALITEKGGEAISVVADVADPEALRAAAQEAVSRFGRIDTWVNNAGTGMFGTIEQIDVADDRRLFETNFWGIVNGSRLAVEYLRDHGGALINLGSEVSDVAVPIQAMYASSKHAVKGFTDGLRMELAAAGVPISVTLVKPAAINTPFAKHAKNYMEVEPTLPAPVYDPSLVASAILFVAEHPRRDIFVGGGGKIMSKLSQEMPGLMGWISSKIMPGQQRTDRPATNRDGALHAPNEPSGEVRGGVERDRMIRTHSAYNTVVQHPVISGSVVTLVIGGLAAYLLLTRYEPDNLRDRAKRWSSGWGEDLSERARDWGSFAQSRAQSLADRARTYGSDLHDTLEDRLQRGLRQGIKEGTKQVARLSKQANSLSKQASSFWN